MNVAPSNLPRLAGAASLSKPGFDIILAVTAARQGALPTATVLRAKARQDFQADLSSARRAMLCGTRAENAAFGPKPTRFFDLSMEANVLPESVNSLFTRGFQPLLNSSDLDSLSSDAPRPDDEHME